MQLFVFGNIPFRQIVARSQPIPFHISESFVIGPEFLGNPQKRIGLFAVEQTVKRLLNPESLLLVQSDSHQFDQFVGLRIIERNCVATPLFSRGL